MIGFIRQEILRMIPYAIAICSICLLMLITAVITRVITIHNMRRFWPEMESQEIEKRDRRIAELKKDNKELSSRNEELYVKVKTFKSVADTVRL